MGNFHVKPKRGTPEPAPPPAPKAKVSNTQAGAVAWRAVATENGSSPQTLWIAMPVSSWAIHDEADGICTIEYAYTAPSAAVPVEALEGLVAEWREDADDMHASAMRAQKRGDMEAMYCNLDAAKDARGYADELIQIIKEYSNG